VFDSFRVAGCADPVPEERLATGQAWPADGLQPGGWGVPARQIQSLEGSRPLLSPFRRGGHAVAADGTRDPRAGREPRGRRRQASLVARSAPNVDARRNKWAVSAPSDACVPAPPVDSWCDAAVAVLTGRHRGDVGERRFVSSYAASLPRLACEGHHDRQLALGHNAPVTTAEESTDAASDAASSTMRVYRLLRDRILSGRLPAGGIVSQARIAAELGISRSPLREALRLLQNEGLVEGEHNRRMVVAAVTAPDLEDIYVMRLFAEPFAVRVTVPDLSDAEIDELAAANQAMRTAQANPGPAATDDPHKSFHMLLCSHSGLRLMRHIEDLWDLAERYRVLPVVDAPQARSLHMLAIVEHDAMTVAARSRDGDRCADLLAGQLARVGLTTVALLEPEYDPGQLRRAIESALGLPASHAPTMPRAAGASLDA
jgi:DNA-binding GntR family transcriptional regulator